jgi:hypothetical protein
MEAQVKITESEQGNGHEDGHDKRKTLSSQ